MAIRIVNKRGISDTEAELLHSTDSFELGTIVYCTDTELTYVYQPVGPDGLTTWELYGNATIYSSVDIGINYDNQSVVIDASLGNITLTWQLTEMQNRTIYLTRIDNSINDVFINSTTPYGTESFLGNPLPYRLELKKHEALPITCKNDLIYIKH